MDSRPYCPDCDGYGRIPLLTKTYICTRCSGSGHVDSLQELKREFRQHIAYFCDGCMFCQTHCECGPDGKPAPCDLKSSPPLPPCKKCNYA